MNRKSAVALILVIVLSLTGPVLAQGQGNGNGQNNGNGQGNGNGQDKANDGNGQGNGNNNGNNGKSGSAADGQADTGGVPDTVGQAGQRGVELSESDVLAAVQAGQAVSLSTILPDVRRRTGGEVINAQLQQVGAYLVYAITVLTPGGDVSTEFYLARSGQHVNR